MPDLTPTSDDADDDALAEALADEWVARAATDPALRRIALRAVGLLPEPRDASVEELARQHGTDRHTLNRIAKNALRRLKLHPRISALKNEYQPPHP